MRRGFTAAQGFGLMLGLFLTGGFLVLLYLGFPPISVNSFDVTACFSSNQFRPAPTTYAPNGTGYNPTGYCNPLYPTIGGSLLGAFLGFTVTAPGSVYRRIRPGRTR